MTKSQFDESNFDRWFANPQNRKQREAEMERSGIPLEIRVRRALRKVGYKAFRDFYEKNGIYHELDFMAVKKIRRIQLPYDFRVEFYLQFLGECKHSETHDFFAFEAEDIEFAMRYPLRLHREDVPFQHSKFPGEPFNFPFLAERIVEVQASTFKSRQDGNYQDRVTFEACEKLVEACKSIQSYVGPDDEMRSDVFEELSERYYALENKLSTRTEAVDRLISEDEEKIFREFNNFTGFLGVPLLVLDDNRGLVKTALGETGKPVFQGEAETVLYPHHTKSLVSSPEFHSRNQLGDMIPIVICKHKSLLKTTKLIEDGSRKLLDNFEKVIQENPKRFIAELISAQVLDRLARQSTHGNDKQ